MTTHQEARVNPYRYGVLEGNHVEDRFGLDLYYKENEHNWPKSTMKDEYRWYNSNLFHKRKELTKNAPEELLRVETDPKVIPFLRQGPNFGPNSAKNQAGNGAGGDNPAEFYVCCPQETDATKAIPNIEGKKPDVVESVPFGATQEQIDQTKREIEGKASTDPNRNPNKFVQYGAWSTYNDPASQLANTMYTVQHRPEYPEVVAHHDAGDQEQNCKSHILFGHGINIGNFRDRDFRSTNSLSYDDKVKPQEFINPKFKADQNARARRLKEEIRAKSGLPPANEAQTGALGGQGQLVESQQIGGETAQGWSAKGNNNPLRWGSREALSQVRHKDHYYKSYDDFTKTFDKSELNTKLRKLY